MAISVCNTDNVFRNSNTGVCHCWIGNLHGASKKFRVECDDDRTEPDDHKNFSKLGATIVLAIRWSSLQQPKNTKGHPTQCGTCRTIPLLCIINYTVCLQDVLHYITFSCNRGTWEICFVHTQKIYITVSKCADSLQCQREHFVLTFDLRRQHNGIRNCTIHWQNISYLQSEGNAQQQRPPQVPCQREDQNTSAKSIQSKAEQWSSSILLTNTQILNWKT